MLTPLHFDTWLPARGIGLLDRGARRPKYAAMEIGEVIDDLLMRFVQSDPEEFVIARVVVVRKVDVVFPKEVVGDPRRVWVNHCRDVQQTEGLTSCCVRSRSKSKHPLHFRRAGRMRWICVDDAAVSQTRFV